MPVQILLLLLSPIILVGGAGLLMSILPLLLIGFLFDLAINFVFTLSKLTIAGILAGISLLGMAISQGPKLAVYAWHSLQNISSSLLTITTNVAAGIKNAVVGTYCAIKDSFKLIFNSITSIFKKAPDHTPAHSYATNRDGWEPLQPSAPPLRIIQRAKFDTSQNKDSDLIPVAEIVQTYDFSHNNHSKNTL